MQHDLMPHDWPWPGAIAGRCFDIDGDCWHRDDERCPDCGFGMTTTPQHRRTPGKDEE